MTAIPASIELRDGRRLTYRVVGSPESTGFPVLYMHGAIGTPMQRTAQLEPLMDRLGVRYVMVNRPGFGGSDHAPGRSIAGFADDVEQLADALALERFAVAGVSAGGPYALACAHRLGARISAVAACSSLSPLCAPHQTPGMRRRVRLPLTVLARAPELCTAIGDTLLPVVRRHPALLHNAIAVGASRADRRTLDDARERAAAVDGFMGATADGVRGMVEDYQVYARAWGFAPSEIRTEVHLWHGMADALVPVEHALQLAAALPSCRAFFDPDEGHHFFRRRLDAIVGALVGRAPMLPVFSDAQRGT